MASKRSNESPGPSPNGGKKSRITPDRELSPCDISSPESNATVKGVVMSLSSAKSGKNLFFGELSDGDAIIPLVGFEKHHRQFLHSHMNSVPLTLRGCQITENRTTGKLQVVIKSYTTIEESSDKELQIENISTLGSQEVTIHQLHALEPYERVTLDVRVVRVKPPMTVTGGKQKQQVIIADSSGTTSLTLWEEDIGLLSENKSYHLHRVQVHRYLGRTELTLPSFGATIEEIDNLEEIVVYEDDDQIINLKSVTIIGVNMFETSFNCVNCKKPMSCNPNDTTTQCGTCDTKQRLRNPKISAKLFVEDAVGQHITLRAHTQVIMKIIDNSPIMSDTLLEAVPFNLTYNKYRTITSVSCE